MAEAQASLVAGGVAGLRRDEPGNPVGFLRGGVVRNGLPNHGLEDSQLVQGQEVCHEAVGENRDELNIDVGNILQEGEPEGLEGCEE